MEFSLGIDVLERLKIAANSETDLDLASKLGLSKQAIADSKSKKRVPSSWIPKAAVLFNVSADWLFFGRDPMGLGDTLHVQQHDQVQATTQEGVVSCPRCAKLDAELALEKAERRVLSAENRQWAAKIEKLLCENGDLRERCARFEERQACRNAG